MYIFDRYIIMIYCLDIYNAEADTMARTNTTKYALLGMLAFESATGYDIKKAMQETTNHFWSESDGAIYPILKELLDDGLVSCTIENEESGRPRKVYSITTDGRSELEEWLELEPSIYRGRNELLLKVFFGEHTNPQSIIRHIEKFQTHVKEQLNLYEKFQKNSSTKKTDKKNIYHLLALKAGILALKSKIQWCDEALTLLKGIKNE